VKTTESIAETVRLKENVKTTDNKVNEASARKNRDLCLEQIRIPAGSGASSDNTVTENVGSFARAVRGALRLWTPLKASVSPAEISHQPLLQSCEDMVLTGQGKVGLTDDGVLLHSDSRLHSSESNIRQRSVK